ncbi:YkgJ family cysteine cluster protein, partial [Escherichia coli]
MSNPNPCMTCGACCAFFRVSFYWAEADDAGGNVPVSLTEQISPLSPLSPLSPFGPCGPAGP